MVVIYNVDYLYVQNFKGLNSRSTLLKFSKLNLSELLVIGDFLILDNKKKECLYLQEISLLRFLRQLKYGLKNLDEKGESKFSSINNDYEIELKLVKGVVTIKDLTHVSVNHHKLVKRIEQLLDKILDEIVFLYPEITDSTSFQQILNEGKKA